MQSSIARSLTSSFSGQSWLFEFIWPELQSRFHILCAGKLADSKWGVNIKIQCLYILYLLKKRSRRNLVTGSKGRWISPYLTA